MYSGNTGCIAGDGVDSPANQSGDSGGMSDTLPSDKVKDEAVIRAVLVSADIKADDHTSSLRMIFVHMWVHVDK